MDFSILFACCFQKPVGRARNDNSGQSLLLEVQVLLWNQENKQPGGRARHFQETVPVRILQFLPEIFRFHVKASLYHRRFQD